jgi:hypothetical protein
MPPGNLPRHRGSPVVTDKMSVRQTEGVEQADGIGNKVFDAVRVDAGGPGIGRVSPLVRCDDAKPGGSQ